MLRIEALSCGFRVLAYLKDGLEFRARGLEWVSVKNGTTEKVARGLRIDRF